MSASHRRASVATGRRASKAAGNGADQAQLVDQEARGLWAEVKTGNYTLDDVEQARSRHRKGTNAPTPPVRFNIVLRLSRRVSAQINKGLASLLFLFARLCAREKMACFLFLFLAM